MYITTKLKYTQTVHKSNKYEHIQVCATMYSFLVELSVNEEAACTVTGSRQF
jgi:hypothetical protein